MALLAEALAQGRCERLVLSAPRQAVSATQAARVTARPLQLRGQPVLSGVWHFPTRDETHNLPLPQALQRVAAELGGVWRHAHLLLPSEEWALRIGKKGSGHLARTRREAPPPDEAAAEPAPALHDRAKQRWLDVGSPFLVALGVTTPAHQVVPAMARKWKQINRFVEIVGHALAEAGLVQPAAPQPLRVVDFGAGRAYLTFAVHDWLRRQGVPLDVRGVELRADLVEQGNRAVRELGLAGLQLVQGDVMAWPAGPLDVMIALHACDTATDHAIHLGVQGGARVIVCSPCCHKQLRPQLLSPHPLRSIFQHGIHAEQQAEMLTDTLRALLLQAQGYETQVFEFVALEHTRKNKMILALRRDRPAAQRERQREQALQQVAELKAYFGVREQRLEELLSTAG